MGRKKHHNQTMNQCRIWRTEGIVGNIYWYEYEDGDNADADKEDYGSQGEDEST
jgi:hypothetical protein